MNLTKRIFLFMAVNILIIGMISVLLSVLGVQPYLTAKGINYQSLMIFCVIWGFGGAFISLALSKFMAKKMMGVKIIAPDSRDLNEQKLVQKIYAFSRNAGLKKMPEVGYYESDELNAFATGATKSSSLVAVSTGLLSRMNEKELDGVLAHEVAHIANGDMVTMTLLQGVVNSFVMFLARVLGFFAGQFVDEEKRGIVQFGIVIALEIFLGMLGMMVVSYFSRKREYKADAGGASLANRESMIAALEKLKQNYQSVINKEDEQPALATLKISGKPNGFLKLFSTHPDIDDRILRLRNAMH
ncbi:MAG: protease HtpX [Pseudobdellovibrio sp.]